MLLWIDRSLAGGWLSFQRSVATSPRNSSVGSKASQSRVGFHCANFYHIRNNRDSKVSSRHTRKLACDGRQNAAVVQSVARRSDRFRSSRVLRGSHKDFTPCTASARRQRRVSRHSAHPKSGGMGSRTLPDLALGQSYFLPSSIGGTSLRSGNQANTLPPFCGVGNGLSSPSAAHGIGGDAGRSGAPVLRYERSWNFGCRPCSAAQAQAWHGRSHFT